MGVVMNDAASILGILQLIQELVDGWNSHDVAQVMRCYHDDFVGADVNQKKQLRGPQAIGRAMEYQLSAFPDLQIEAEEPVIQDNRAALVWTITGTHRGRIMNIPPTGRPVEFRGVTMITVKGGKISESFRIWDVASMLRSLGCLPDL
jgi:steroid delta-isomerase-like uncharacterized protein